MPAAKLAVTVDGPDGAPVLVLANPVGTSVATWQHQAPVLSRHFRVVRFEHRGHGPAGARSPAQPGPYTIAELGADVLGMLSALGIEQAGYAGVSLGGMIGIWLAANAPERITSLAVACAALVPLPSAQAWRDRAATARSQGTGATADMAVQRWFTPAFRARRPDEVSAAVESLKATTADGYAGCGEAIAAMDLRPLLASVKARTLVLAGAEDLAAPPAQGALTATGIRGARLVVLRGAAHFAHIEAPGQVTSELLRHFRSGESWLCTAPRQDRQEACRRGSLGFPAPRGSPPPPSASAGMSGAPRCCGPARVAARSPSSLSACRSPARSRSAARSTPSRAGRRGQAPAWAMW
jgi:3-oxoadipate enol-lactonase